jgi:hypothetical protein
MLYSTGKFVSAATALLALAFVIGFLASCGGTGSNISATTSPGPAGVAVTISPSATSISTGGTQTFSAAVSGNTNTNVTWTASAGTISGASNTITYTAPSAAGSYTLTATSVADTTKSGTAAISAVTNSTNSCAGIALGQGASLNGFHPFPATNAWNQDISTAAVDANSASILGFIGTGVGLHADFGSGTLSGATIGIPYVVVDSTQANVNVNVGVFAGESDITPSPIPATAPIEGFPNAGDNHVLVLDKTNCWLYELGNASVTAGNWSASGSTVWDLQTYNDRPLTWTSVDAAGLPIFAGLVRFDEVATGTINHAIRFTVPATKSAFVSPATHWAGNSSTSPIPMGMQLRLKSTLNVSGFSANNQVILNAMKKFGLIVADNGSAIFISGAPDNRWDNNDLHALGTVTAANFDVVQMPTQISSGNVPTGSAPAITSFTASATTVTAGTAVTLSWQASGASYYLISPLVGPARGNSIVVNPAATTTYTLSATNAFGRNTKTVTVTVQ